MGPINPNHKDLSLQTPRKHIADLKAFITQLVCVLKLIGFLSMEAQKKKETWCSFELNISDYPTVYDLATYQAPLTKMKSVVNIKYLKSIALDFMKN